MPFCKELVHSCRCFASFNVAKPSTHEGVVGDVDPLRLNINSAACTIPFSATTFILSERTFHVSEVPATAFYSTNCLFFG
ncbi:hypothetical protein M378DRAFT_174293 [Amanita muscaria Koide BX008]|uniref:Uncharacterized protein n=1 Tax=Amanita muscaria (strain Koide BX008) TaxID=946122 RepID=A0A0C2RVU5_AMAMK|nr:hypothetical protein M378DRAFT_174293 [Amanita muscaria Koide BX008]